MMTHDAVNLRTIGLLRDSRKTERGAILYLLSLAVRAAPFALMST